MTTQVTNSKVMRGRILFLILILTLLHSDHTHTQICSVDCSNPKWKGPSADVDRQSSLYQRRVTQSMKTVWRCYLRMCMWLTFMTERLCYNLGFRGTGFMKDTIEFMGNVGSRFFGGLTICKISWPMPLCFWPFLFKSVKSVLITWVPKTL